MRICTASRVALVVAFGAFASIAPPATAQTADGQTPAQESACSGQTGAAYGLCTSYCEAMDCDSAAPAANATACSKVYNNFLRLTGGAPPCLCPCSAGWATVQQAAADANLPITTCSVADEESMVEYGGPAVRLNLVSYSVEGSFCTGWNNSATPLVSVSPLSAAQIAACRSIISGICAAQP